jgi:FtsP/CotA-like multicopper oxidase with cupredoxin domain
MAKVRIPTTFRPLKLTFTGRYQGKGSYYEQKFKPGKKYLLRIINGSTGFHFHWSLDNHVIKVIAADFVPIKPYTTESLSVGIGQRYTVIIEAKPTQEAANGKYWMRTEYVTAGGCNARINGNPVNDKDSQRVGIVSYEGAASEGSPETTRNLGNKDVDCLDETPKMQPIVKWQVTPPENPNYNDEHLYEAGLDRTKGPNNSNKWHGAVARWSLTDTPMWLDFSNPTILNLDNSTWNPEYGVVHCMSSMSIFPVLNLTAPR